VLYREIERVHALRCPDLRWLQETVGGPPTPNNSSRIFSVPLDNKYIRQKPLHSRRVLRDELGSHARCVE
jgi:hypothetical protein